MNAAGAVVACVACTRTDDELRHVLHDQSDLYRELGSDGPFAGSKLWKLRQLLRKGRMYDYAKFHEHMAWFSKGLTFREVCRLASVIVVDRHRQHRHRHLRAPPAHSPLPHCPTSHSAPAPPPPTRHTTHHRHSSAQDACSISSPHQLGAAAGERCRCN